MAAKNHDTAFPIFTMGAKSLFHFLQEGTLTITELRILMLCLAHMNRINQLTIGMQGISESLNIKRQNLTKPIQRLQSLNLIQIKLIGCLKILTLNPYGAAKGNHAQIKMARHLWDETEASSTFHPLAFNPVHSILKLKT